MLQATTQSTAIQEGRHRDARSNYGITCPTTAANGKYSLPYPFAALLFAAEGTAPLVDSRTSEATEAVAKRRDSRRREGRDGRETAAEEEVHEGRRRGGRWGRGEVESAVAVAMEARQLLCVGGALSLLLSWFPNGNLVERVSTARSASAV
jgi:hypothetical protein